jgi:hypothetical protein
MSMTTSNTHQTRSTRVPVSQVVIGNEVLDVKVLGMKMQRSSNQHDAVVLAMSSPTLTDTEGLVNEPINFIYGRSASIDAWYGYVTGVAEVQRDDVNLSFSLTLIGATLPMQLGTSRFWASTSITSVVRDLLYTNLLGHSGSSHPYLWKALAQTSETDWQMSVKLAQRLGFALFSWNGVVIFEDPMVLYNSNGPYVRLAPETDMDAMDRQMIEFTPAEAAERTYTGRGGKIAYLTQDGKVGWARQKGYERHKFMTGLPVRSQEEAEIYVAAMDKRSDVWLQTATARVQGDAMLRPGINVDVMTAAGWRQKKFDGKWLVSAVQHSMDPKDFQSSLTLARPRATVPVPDVPYRTPWDIEGRAKPFMYMYGEGADRQWASSWADTRLRSILNPGDERMYLS